jgi:hypothetical protein
MKYRKILIVTMSIFLLFTLIGCNGEIPIVEETIEEKFSKADLIEFPIGEGINNVVTGFTVITEFETYPINWESDNQEVIKFQGDSVVVTNQMTDVIVNLTATLIVSQQEEYEKKFAVTVKHKEDEEIDMTRKGTFNRKYPSYYTVNKPLIDDAHIVYINWDGFAHYYLEEFLASPEGQNSTLKQLMSEGVYFPNLRNTYPSITNPCQNQILSGGTSLITENVYRYYSKKSDTVIQQQRENVADILPVVTVRNNISTVSFAMYLVGEYPEFQNSSLNHLYVPASGGHAARMDQAISMFKGEPVNVGGIDYIFTELPKFTLIYCDDLDAVGHNEASHYGYEVSPTEEGRRANIQSLLKEMDEKLGELIRVTKARGIYDQLTFFLTTDHGMTPFSGLSKLRLLEHDLNTFNSKYVLERVQPGKKPKTLTSVVGVTANLNMYMTFKNGITDTELDQLKEYLLTLDYVYEVYTREELRNNYLFMRDVDMLVVPKEGMHFVDTGPIAYISPRGQHDTTADSSNHVVGLIWGKGIKKNTVFDGEAYNYDFGITMAAALGVDLPKANGIVLDVFERKEE